MNSIAVKITLLVLAALLVWPSDAQGQKRSRQSAKSTIPVEQIVSMAHDEFGPQVQVDPRIVKPFYLLGDFNGDGYADIAVIVNVEEAKADLKKYGVKYIDVDAYSRSNGLQIDPVSTDAHNCLGVAIAHGTNSGWKKPAAKYMFYECFSSFKLVRRGQKIRRGSGSSGRTPRPQGDSIFLDLETGGTALVYWNGKTYRGFGLRGGD